MKIPKIPASIMAVLMLASCLPTTTTPPTTTLEPSVGLAATRTGTSVATPNGEGTVYNLDEIPPLDTTQHCVPLDSIYFDTFNATNRAVALTAASPSLIRSLRDAIPPIYNPIFEEAELADEWLSDSDVVLGYVDGSEAYAYPVRILNFHEIVSHHVNGRAVMATYCPLCRSGIMYDRTVNGKTHLFGNTSALHESDLVMLDYATGSYWAQVSGKALVGPLTGIRLPLLSSQTTTWGNWRAQYPQTLSLSRDTGNRRDYSRDPFVGYAEQLSTTRRFSFPVSEAVDDLRLPAGEIVLGVQLGETVAAYPVAQIGNAVINDVVAGTAIVIFSTDDGPSGAAYSSTVDGKTLTFTWSMGVIRDEQTDSRWDFAGRAISGELEGSRLEPLPVRSSLWFALIAAYPDLLLKSSKQ